MGACGQMDAGHTYLCLSWSVFRGRIYSGGWQAGCYLIIENVDLVRLSQGRKSQLSIMLCCWIKRLELCSGHNRLLLPPKYKHIIMGLLIACRISEFEPIPSVHIVLLGPWATNRLSTPVPPSPSPLSPIQCMNIVNEYSSVTVKSMFSHYT